jgi:hypothetical protein
MNKTAILPGGFKPPTLGHFYLAQEVISRPEMNKLIILIGPKEREGITKEQSLEIWNIYKKYLKGNIEIQLTQSPSPIQDIHGIVKNNPNDFFYPIVGTRGDDTSDIKRYDTLSKYPNQKVIIINSPTDEISGTKARKEILNGNFEGFQKYTPTELNMEDRKKIWNILTLNQDKKDIFGLKEHIQSLVNENISKGELDSIEKTADKWFKEYNIDVTFTKHFFDRVNDSRNGKPITSKELLDLFYTTAKKYGDELSDEDDFEAVLHKIQNDLNLPFIIKYNRDKKGLELIAKTIMRKRNFMTSNPKLPLEENKSIKKQQILDNIKSLTEYMIKQGLNIKPLPKLKFIDNDEENANNFFGKTAYYNPIDNLIVLYTKNRHPKDICRSYSHEMTHHLQNLENRLQNITTQNTNEDDNLLELEKEAYLKGNIIFRNWTDSINNPQTLNEGRYDKVTNVISSDVLKKWKQGFSSGKKYSILDTFYESPNTQLSVIAKIFFIPGFNKYRVDGSMDEDGEVLLIDFKIDPTFLPEYWEEISYDLKDVIRHEIEHSTQTDHPINSRPGKYMEDDTLARQAIQAKLIPQTFYYKLKKEIDANLQGLYLKAKKSKRPFKEVILTYLTDSNLTPEQIEDILDTWRPRARALSLPKI